MVLFLAKKFPPCVDIDRLRTDLGRGHALARGREATAPRGGFHDYVVFKHGLTGQLRNHRFEHGGRLPIQPVQEARSFFSCHQGSFRPVALNRYSVMNVLPDAAKRRLQRDCLTVATSGSRAALQSSANISFSSPRESVASCLSSTDFFSLRIDTAHYQMKVRRDYSKRIRGAIAQRFLPDAAKRSLHRDLTPSRRKSGLPDSSASIAGQLVRVFCQLRQRQQLLFLWHGISSPQCLIDAFSRPELCDR